MSGIGEVRLIFWAEFHLLQLAPASIEPRPPQKYFEGLPREPLLRGRGVLQPPPPQPFLFQTQCVS